MPPLSRELQSKLYDDEAARTGTLGGSQRALVRPPLYFDRMGTRSKVFHMNYGYRLPAERHVPDVICGFL